MSCFPLPGSVHGTPDRPLSMWPFKYGVSFHLHHPPEKRGDMYRQQKTAMMFAEPTIKANWNSAFRSMDFWANARRSTVPPGMVELAMETRYFIKKYESFFERVETALRPEEMDEFNKTLILHRALGTALEEWDTIRHALEQRENSRYAGVLAELDRLSLDCLLPLFGTEKLESHGAFTYLHKLFDIKRFAFSRTPLIGAPFAALTSPEAWLAIPHEAGHYIFWNGTDTFEAFNAFYRRLQDGVLAVVERAIRSRVIGGYFRRRGLVFQTWLDWLDEIFADVFGTLAAGPAYAWSLQSNLRAAHSIRDLYHSHEEPEHPHPFIRPFFHIAALREMAKAAEGEFASRLAEEADALEASWRQSWFEVDADREIDRLPTPDGIGVMSDILAQEVPGITALIVNAGLGENLPKTLIQYFKEGVLYNQALHDAAMETASRIAGGETVLVDPPLQKSIAAQMAILLGADPLWVHEALGYGGREDSPEPDGVLDERFEEFISNVTGKTEPQAQLEGWRRVLGYSLVEQAFHWHTHSHTH